MIPTYHCAGFLRETLAGVLAQDPGPELMQIEVVDDASTRDDPEAVVREVGRGRVGFFRQPENVGHVRNFETCLLRSRGRLIHLLHGDDGVRPGFYEVLGSAFKRAPEIGAAWCRQIILDERGRWQSISKLEQPESGILPDWLETLALGQRLQAPSIVVRREVYERLGGFDRRIAAYGEDWEMWARIAAHYPVWFEVEPLALYRVHSNSLTGGGWRNGTNGRDLRRAARIIEGHLPADRARRMTRKSMESFALACLRRARRALKAGDRDAVSPQMREALLSSRSPEVLARTLLLGVALGRDAWRRLRGASRSPEGSRA